MSANGFVGLTIETARRALAQEFRAAGIDTPDLDARVLVGTAMQLDLTGLAAAAHRPLNAVEAQTLAAFAERRLAHEPVARIVGVKEFWGLPLMLSAATLVPRGDTETVVEAALELVRAGGEALTPLRIADIGTGSGAILLALLHELPQAQGIGTDISVAALRVAQVNADKLDLASRATFIACDYADKLDGPFDLIVSNPPYIARSELAALPPEVRDYDPPRALDGGTDGLTAYRALAGEIARLLVPGGAFAIEVGQGQADDVAALMQGAGLHTIRPHRHDLAQIARVVWGRKTD